MTAFDDSGDRQIELLLEVRRDLAAVVTATKQCEAQAARLEARAVALHGQAKSELAAGLEGAARQTLGRRLEVRARADEFSRQAAVLGERRDVLRARELALTDRLGRFGPGSRVGPA